jgi:hypothetical protein
MTKKIKFVAKNPYGWETQPRPVPATNLMPKWWRDAPPYGFNQGDKFVVENGASNASIKKCTPMLDALTSGYIVTLWSDVQVRQTSDGPVITWRVTGDDVFEMHGLNSRQAEPPAGYTNAVLKYHNTWIPKTPKGYSVLCTAPFGYRNLPFHAVPGVIDADKVDLQIIFPMWLKEGFEGVVEKGTPLVQITPFKRENWEAEFSHYEKDEYLAIEDRSFGANLVHHYVRNVWSRKSYK